MRLLSDCESDVDGVDRTIVHGCWLGKLLESLLLYRKDEFAESELH